MARVTQAQAIQREVEAQALAFFESALAALPDPRRAQGTRYPLRSVVVIALMAMVCGSDDAEAMELWGKANEKWLSGFLELPHGTPTQDVFLMVFAALDAVAFSGVFRAWAELLSLRLKATGRQIAIDGKTSRRSFDSAKGQPALHTVSAWLSEAGLVLGQCKTADKSNEIIAIPELLGVLDLSGARVTIDAIGCQTEIASTIVERGGDYLLSVKENQPTLHQDIVRTFVESANPRRRGRDELSRPAVAMHEEHDKGHGRVERRKVSVCGDLSWVTTKERWAGLSFVAQVERERTTLGTGKTSVELAYYIGSGPTPSAASVAQLIRGHWGIETELHWVLDMAFREDEARHRSGNTAQNMATLRHFALNIIRRDRKRKLGVANCRKRAGWDRNYLIELLTNVEE